MTPLWTVEAMARATNATRVGPLPASVNGISIDDAYAGRVQGGKH